MLYQTDVRRRSGAALAVIGGALLSGGSVASDGWVHVQSDALRIAYCYTTTGGPPEEQAAYLEGFLAGLQSTGLEARPRVYSDTSGNPGAAASLAATALRDHPSVVVGLPSTRELIRALPVLLESEVMCLSLVSGHPMFLGMSPWLYSTGEKMMDAAQGTLDLFEALYPARECVIVYDDTSSIGVSGMETLRGLVEGESHRFVSLTSRRVLPERTLALLASHNAGLIVTTPPRESISLMEQLDDAGVDVPIVGVNTWTGSDPRLLNRLLARRSSALHSLAVWTPGLAAGAEFESRLLELDIDRRRWGRAAHGFDAGVIVGSVAKRMGTAKNAQAFFAAFHRNRDFPGCSSGVLRFSAAGGQPSRPVAYVEYEGGKWVHWDPETRPKSK